MASIDEVLRNTLIQIYRRLERVENQVHDVNAESGEIVGFHFSTAFPSNPYPHQVVVKTNETGVNPGGAMYRYDQATTSWLALN